MHEVSNREGSFTNFDLVKQKYLNNLGHSENDAQSVDALTQTEKAIVFIEFKNGRVHNSDVKTKIRDSLLIYCDITKSTISTTRADSVLVLVYNLESNPIPNQLTKGEPPTWKSQLYIVRKPKREGHGSFTVFLHHSYLFPGADPCVKYAYKSIEYGQFIFNSGENAKGKMIVPERNRLRRIWNK